MCQPLYPVGMRTAYSVQHDSLSKAMQLQRSAPNGLVWGGVHVLASGPTWMLDGDCASCRMRLGACSFCAHEVIQADIFLIVTSCFGARVHYYAPHPNQKERAALSERLIRQAPLQGCLRHRGSIIFNDNNCICCSYMR